MAKIKAGIIGLGWPGIQHLKGYQACSESEVIAICDINEELLRRVAKEYGIGRIYRDYKRMLKDEPIEVVSVCLPNYLHHPVTIDCLEAGRHVICEKPPALNAQQAREMAAKAKAEGRILMYALMQRFNAEPTFLKAAIESGELGDIYFAEAAYVRRRGIPIGSGGWFVDRARSGGGALIDIGVHALDLAWWLMGNPKPSMVSASSYSKFSLIVPKELKYDVEDSAFAFLRFENGASMILKATWALNLKGGSHTHIAGTKGGATMPPLVIYSEKEGIPLDITPQLPQVNAFDREIAHFVECVKKGERPIPSAEQGITLMEMLDAIYESSSCGKEVAIP
ncbi:MAG: Gfo/Idh/MocA family oxidoreductase [Candidatus Bathyarchaeia archaeon]